MFALIVTSILLAAYGFMCIRFWKKITLIERKEADSHHNPSAAPDSYKVSP
jgi:hypothetical protein